MISPASKVRCSICCKRATRAVRDEYGVMLDSVQRVPVARGDHRAGCRDPIRLG